MGYLIYKFIKKNLVIYNNIYESKQIFYRRNNCCNYLLFNLHLFCIDFNSVCTAFIAFNIKIIFCDFFLVRKEPINTRQSQRVPFFRVNDLKLFQKDIRSYQKVSTVLENLCVFCASQFYENLVKIYEACSSSLYGFVAPGSLT